MPFTTGSTAGYLECLVRVGSARCGSGASPDALSDRLSVDKAFPVDPSVTAAVVL